MAVRKSRKIIFGVIAMVLAVSATLLLVEIGFRIVFFQPRGRVVVPNEYRVSELSGVPYELTPNHSYVWKYGPRHLLDRGFSVPVSINSDGYRDDELQEPKAENEYRILALGDSFTLGLGVHREDCWVEQLEMRLNDASASLPEIRNRRVQVINTGVGSYNTVTQLNYLRQKGMTHQPDAVILAFLINDFNDDPMEYTVDDRGLLVPRYDTDSRIHLQSLLYEESSSGNIFQRLMKSSHLVRWASGRTMKYQKHTLMEFRGKSSLERTFTAVRGIYDVTESAGIPLYVCIFPYLDDVIPESDKADLDKLAEVCRLLGVPFIRMEEALAGLAASDLRVHPKDHHPNADAHRRYADMMFARFFSVKQAHSENPAL